jgi:exodeoxyribonuclease V beta subunit
VALTRARYRLYLPHYPPELEKLKGPYRRANLRLDDILGERHERACRHFSVRICPIDAIRGRAVVPAGAAVQAALWPRAFAPPREPDDLAAIKAERSGFAVTSYTAVKHARGAFAAVETDLRVASELALGKGNDEDNREASRETEHEELPGGAETGIFLHDILATVGLADLASMPNFADWYAKPAVARLLEGSAGVTRDPPPTCPWLRDSCTGPTRRRCDLATVIAGLASAPVALREVEFLFPMPELRIRFCHDRRPALGGRARRGEGFRGSSLRARWPRLRVRLEERRPAKVRRGHAGRHCEQNYDVQARIYTIAALRLCGIRTPADYARRFGGVVFCFLRGLDSRRDADPDKSADTSAGIHFLQPTWEDILAWETDMLGQQFWGMSR